jgi:hypothetical protein
MANIRISELDALTSTQTTDLVEIVDVSDTSMAATGTNKRITVANLTASKANSGANSDITSLSGITTPLTVAQGGIGVGTLTDGGLLVGATTGAVEALTAGTTSQILVGGGSGTNPAWGTDIPTAVTIGSKYVYRADGTDVPVADGGTGASTLTGIIKGNGASAFSAASAGDADSIVSASSLTVAGKVELATTAEINTGTDSTRAMPVDQFVASNRNVHYLMYRVLGETTDTAAASSTALGGDLECPITGTIIEVGAYNDVAGTTGTATYDIHLGGTTIMASTKISIETGEKSSRDATTQPTISTSAITAGNILTFFCDAVQSGTAAKGLTFRVGIRLT